MLKNLFFAAVLLLLIFGCKRDSSALDDISELSQVALDSVKVPSDTLTLGASMTVSAYSQMQTGCELFYKFNYAPEGGSDPDARLITAMKAKNNDICGRYRTVTGTFSFVPKSTGTYTLKFWAGGDSWITKTVVVE